MGDFSLFGVDYWGLLSGNMYVVHPGTRRSRAPCDRDTVTILRVGLTIGAYCWRNTDHSRVTDLMSQYCPGPIVGGNAALPTASRRSTDTLQRTYWVSY